jgi:hypothetical protein
MEGMQAKKIPGGLGRGFFYPLEALGQSAQQEDSPPDRGQLLDGVPQPKYPDLYQPLPLSWKPDRDMSFSTGPPQAVQVVTGGSENF